MHSFFAKCCCFVVCKTHQQHQLWCRQLQHCPAPCGVLGVNDLPAVLPTVHSWYPRGIDTRQPQSMLCTCWCRWLCVKQQCPLALCFGCLRERVVQGYYFHVGMSPDRFYAAAATRNKTCCKRIVCLGKRHVEWIEGHSGA